MGRELKDLTVGIIGTGQIGSTVIKELSGFGCRILAYNRYKNPRCGQFLAEICSA